jgi:3-oxoacyl-[acyl-carrier-protein] synthase-1
VSARITALGMSSPLGGAVQGVAAFRAGISRVAASRELVCGARGDSDPQPLPVLEASGVSFGLRGVGRLVALLCDALQDLAPAADLPGLAAELPVFLAVPDPMARGIPVEEALWRDAPGRASALGERVLEQAFENLGLRRGRQPWRFFGGGHAAFSSAVAAAHQGLRQRDFSACLVAAVDSLVIPEVLEAMLGEGWLKTPDNPVGFIPGEAAVAAWLTVSGSGEAPEPLALLRGVTLGHEPRGEGSDSPPVGHVLTQCLLTALKDSAVPTERLVLVSDHDGREGRAMELGGLRTLLRGQGVGDGGLGVWLPATGFGNTGAASGAVGLCVAVRSLQRGHAPAPVAAILSASDGPERAALIVSEPSAAST